MSDALQSWLASTFEVCAAVLDAWLAVHAAAPDVTRRLERVDSILLSGQAWNWPIPSHRILARLWESRHEWARALAAIRRRNGHRLEHLAGDLRHEGRLAALAGDTAGSLRAYHHYLSLRSDREPAPRPQRDNVSAEVRQLFHQR